MTLTFRFSLIAAIGIVLSGCVTPKPNMANSVVSTKPVQVRADKALVYFVRPNFLGFAVNAAVYDGDKFVGIVPYDQKLPYIADPGEHMFMVYSEAADFMKAELAAGKTYYVEVQPRMGAWKARFSLSPITKEEFTDPKMRERIDAAKLIENKPEAYTWAEKNKANVLEKKAAYLVKWNEKEELQRPFLRATDAQ